MTDEISLLSYNDYDNNFHLFFSSLLSINYEVNAGFDLQFVLLSLEALGEDEGETESFLQSLNPARKNTLVRCNLQYVLSSLDHLENSHSRDVFDEYKNGPQPPPLSRHFEREHDDGNGGMRNNYQSHSVDSLHKDFNQNSQSRYESKDGEYQKSASVDEYRTNTYRK